MTRSSLEASGLSVFLLFAFLLAPMALPDTTWVEGELPAVSVTAARVEVAPSMAPARITLLDPREAEGFGVRSVADLLDARTTAFVRRHGPAGLSSVSLRGTSASQTLILLDGNRIADPQLGQLDLSLLPTILLDRVEIMHGAASALHGTDGLGGVVNLQTIRPEASSIDARLTLGAFGERIASGRASASAGNLRGVVAAEASSFDGDFPYFNPNLGTEGDYARRLGADRRLVSAFGRIEADVGATTWHAALWAGSADTGVPGSVGTPTYARQQDEHVRMWGGLRSRTSWGTIRIAGLAQRSRLTYQDDTGQSALASAEVEARIPGPHWMVSSGATVGFGTATHPGLEANASELRLGAFVAVTARYGSVLVYPALRGDLYTPATHSSDPMMALSPRLGLNWRPFSEIALHFKAGVGSAFRAPTFNDRFWRHGADSSAGGDPTLRPEKGWTADVGIHTTVTHIDVEVTVFRSFLTDQIAWLPGSGGLYSAFNVGRTRTEGAEATLNMSPVQIGVATIAGGATYAYTDARDISEEESLPLRYVPRHGATAHASVSTVITSSTSVRGGTQLRYVGRRPVRTDGSLLLPAHVVLDLTAGLVSPLGDATLHLDVGIENLLDADYAIIRGYPMPPRHARLSLRLSL